MDYFNANTNCYPTSPSSGFNAHLNQMPAPEHVAFDFGGLETSPHDWSLSGQQVYASGSQDSLRSEGTFESTSLEASHGGWTPDCGQMSFQQHYWSTSGGCTQPYYTGTMSRNGPSTSTAPLEVPPAIYAPSWCEPPFLQREPSFCRPQTGLLDYWGSHWSGPFTSAFHSDVQPSYQPRTGPSTAGMMQTHRYSPYGVPHSRPIEYTDIETGLSYFAPQPTSYTTLLPTNPSGGSSEATADAEHSNKITEEEATSKTRRRQAATKSREWRFRYGRDLDRLRVWAMKKRGTNQPLSRAIALETALEVVQALRPVPLYPSPRLKDGTRGRKTQNSAADVAAGKRRGIRWINEELSRYYELPAGQTRWDCPKLILKVLGDVESP